MNCMKKFCACFVDLGCGIRFWTNTLSPPPQAPPSINHAPPQMYMLFLINGQTYSQASWVTLYELIN